VINFLVWWCAVAMEYIENAVPITLSSNLSTKRDLWMAELQCLMNDFHKMDLVHGDLRDVNIICKEDSWMLIDFDWGGKDGKVSYPTLNLNDDLLWGRNSDSPIIRKEDDKRVLGNTLAKLISMTE
jgi:tRNA A-37 threonylcarbamoyl transferase component Bud32